MAIICKLAIENKYERLPKKQGHSFLTFLARTGYYRYYPSGINTSGTMLLFQGLTS